jgi:hypothetical protein
MIDGEFILSLLPYLRDGGFREGELDLDTPRLFGVASLTFRGLSSPRAYATVRSETTSKDSRVGLQ